MVKNRKLAMSGLAVVAITCPFWLSAVYHTAKYPAPLKSATCHSPALKAQLLVTTSRYWWPGEGFGLLLKVTDEPGKVLLERELEPPFMYDLEEDINVTHFAIDARTVTVKKLNYTTEFSIPLPTAPQSPVERE